MGPDRAVTLLLVERRLWKRRRRSPTVLQLPPRPGPRWAFPHPSRPRPDLAGPVLRPGCSVRHAPHPQQVRRGPAGTGRHPYGGHAAAGAGPHARAVRHASAYADLRAAAGDGHEAQSFGWIIGIQWNVCRSGFEDAYHRDDHGDGPVKCRPTRVPLFTPCCSRQAASWLARSFRTA